MCSAETKYVIRSADGFFHRVNWAENVNDPKDFRYMTVKEARKLGGDGTELNFDQFSKLSGECTGE